MRLIWVMVDGIGDVAVPSLGHRTCLQAARVPHMDALARYGVNGLMDPVEPGRACGSDTAHMSVFGYDPRVLYRGRGAFESMGAGLPMQPGDIAFKSNFATIDRASRIVVSRRADRDFEGLGPSLCAAIDGLRLPSYPMHSVSVMYATEHRCGVRVRGPGLSDAITGTDPLKDNRLLVKCAPVDATDAAAVFTSALVNELSDEIERVLSAHPINAERIAAGKGAANCVLLRGCGSCLDVPSFEAKHGLCAFMIAPTCIIAGLGQTLRMDVLRVAGATGDYHTNLAAKADRAIEEITSGKYDFGFVHVKAVDDAAHDKDVDKRVTWLERIDALLIGPLVEALAKEEEANGSVRYAVVVTGDHSSPVVYGDHSCEPVPFVVCPVGNVGKADPPLCDAVTAFDEMAASRGVLGRFGGDQVMGLLRQYAHLQ